jgi:hypothetical protein
VGWTQERSCDSSTGRFEAVLPGNFTVTFAPNENVYLYRDDEAVFEQDAPEEDDINQALGLYRKLIKQDETTSTHLGHELLPCPHCGAQAYFHVLSNVLSMTLNVAVVRCSAECVIDGHNLDNAARLWNRRAKAGVR